VHKTDLQSWGKWWRIPWRLGYENAYRYGKFPSTRKFSQQPKMLKEKIDWLGKGNALI
jgi:hypothetical protein